MRRLPKVDDVVKQIVAKADGLQKEAAVSEPTKEFTVPIAKAMRKLAETLRAIDPDEVSLKDVKDFVQRATG